MLHLRPESVRLDLAEAGNPQPLREILPAMQAGGVAAVSAQRRPRRPHRGDRRGGRPGAEPMVADVSSDALLDERRVALVTGAAARDRRRHRRDPGDAGVRDVAGVDCGARPAGAGLPMHGRRTSRPTRGLRPRRRPRPEALRSDRQRLDRWGRLDAAVAAAAVIDGGQPLWETAGRPSSTELFDVNVRGVWNTAAAAVPAMLAGPDPAAAASSRSPRPPVSHGLFHLAGLHRRQARRHRPRARTCRRPRRHRRHRGRGLARLDAHRRCSTRTADLYGTARPGRSRRPTSCCAGCSSRTRSPPRSRSAARPRAVSSTAASCTPTAASGREPPGVAPGPPRATHQAGVRPRSTCSSAARRCGCARLRPGAAADGRRPDSALAPTAAGCEPRRPRPRRRRAARRRRADRGDAGARPRGRARPRAGGPRAPALPGRRRRLAGPADAGGPRTRTVVRLEQNVGPAGARNAGLAKVGTPYVAFVDSRRRPSPPTTLLRLGRHFADRPGRPGRRPASSGRGRSARPRWFERYDERASSLGLGDVGCSVRPGAAVGWLPSACLVARTDRLAARDGRLRRDPAGRRGRRPGLAAGRRRATGPLRPGRGRAPRRAPDHLRGWLGRKFVYGTGGAAARRAARRQGSRPRVLSPAMAARRRGAAAAPAVVGAGRPALRRPRRAACCAATLPDVRAATGSLSTCPRAGSAGRCARSPRCCCATGGRRSAVAALFSRVGTPGGGRCPARRRRRRADRAPGRRRRPGVRGAPARRPRLRCRAVGGRAAGAVPACGQPTWCSAPPAARSSDRPMTIRWIWLVPSKICMTFASRM